MVIISWIGIHRLDVSPLSARTLVLNKKIFHSSVTPPDSLMRRIVHVTHRRRKMRFFQYFFFFFFFLFVYFSFGLSVYSITGFSRVHVIIPRKLVKIRQGCFIYLTYRKSYNIELEFSYRNYYVLRIIKLIPSIIFKSRISFIITRIVTLPGRAFW